MHRTSSSTFSRTSCGLTRESRQILRTKANNCDAPGTSGQPCPQALPSPSPIGNDVRIRIVRRHILSASFPSGHSEYVTVHGHRDTSPPVLISHPYHAVPFFGSVKRGCGRELDRGRAWRVPIWQGVYLMELSRVEFATIRQVHVMSSEQ